MKGRIMKVSKIEDNNGKNYIIRDESFINIF